MGSWTSSLPPARRAELHRAWLHRLGWEYDELNRDRLKHALGMPALGIDVRPTSRLGAWNRLSRTLTIAEHHIADASWEEVVDTLAHEMAHQFADDVLGATDEAAHGAAFAEACRRLRIDARATAPASAPGDDRVLQKVRKLLALAQSHNVHEAEAAMAMANRLLLQHNLELSALGTRLDYGYRRVGERHLRLSVAHKLVASILAESFFVKSLWLTVYDAREDRAGFQLELLGTAANLDLAHYVHDFLHREAELLWRRARPTLRQRGAGARREYLAGVLLGFRARLQQERAESAERGLVWVGDPGLGRYFRERHPRTRSLSGGRLRHSEAHAAGQKAGQELHLRRGVTAHGNGGGLLGA